MKTPANDAPPSRGKSKVTLREVARQSGVSIMTASRVINGASGVKDETRARVEATIEALQFSPNSAARALARYGKRRIGLPHCFPSDAYLGDFLIGCLNQASMAPLQFVIERCPSPTEVNDIVRQMIAERVDGILLPPPLCNFAQTIDDIASYGIPVVAVASGGPITGTVSVSIDDEAASYAMTQHIIALGHRHIGFIKGDERHASTLRRLHGFERAIADAAHLGLTTEVASGSYTYRSGLDAMDVLLSLGRRPTAVFASNDDMAAAAIAAAQQCGLVVPGDITICGFDDTSIASTIWPQLTTIHQPVREMASVAIQLLAQLIDGDGTPPSSVNLPFSLVRRQSDAAPRLRPSARRLGL